MKENFVMLDKPIIVGVDEVGTGALAGSLCVAGVRAPKDWALDGLNDSKKLSAKKREVMQERLLKLISDKEISWHLAERSNFEIDKLGMGVALKSAYIEVFKNLYNKDCLIITDGILKFDNLGVDDYDKISVIKADGKFPTVMAASILAKTYRDEKMKKLHEMYPVYDWIKNVGYAAKNHLDGIKKYGPCVLHRFSYAPIRDIKRSDPRQLIFKDF